MEPNKHQKLQTQIIFKKSKSLKSVLQFLLPISIFSFFLSYSPLITCFLNSLTVIFSTYFSHLFGYLSDRKFIFFLCHGILVFLLGDSGFIRSFPSRNDLYDEFYISNGDILRPGTEFSDIKTFVGEKKQQQQQQQQEEEEEEGEKQQPQPPEEEQEEEGLLSNEEMNIRFEELKRRVTEKTRIGAHQLRLMA
eukprot:TRINITY_DN4872_c0_g1_i2.p1 TRINITY_DN4872_c0_g1~~TRINITY_DN4872_c0_g1_i2.p1  ORF type:complete len:193 (-),score=52.61 TRINITY_DN4872_c0_g1_i2:99-677(-)